MAILKRWFFVLFLFLLISCAKVGYLIEQGSGQLGLQSRARENTEVLKSPRVPKNEKEKIQFIQDLKKYFYKYWNKKETKIYSRTTYLKNKAVTYLVIASPFDRISTYESCFPVVGCFPYLGFFEKKSAEKHAKELREKKLVTYIRPVYAYSTLGYFEDTILSSFFKYNEHELTELIFHELFHTIFFVKDEVELNENLANYFSERMTEEYLKNTGKIKILEEYRKDRELSEKMDKKVVLLATELQILYEKNSPLDESMARELKNDFLRNRFFPEIRKLCLETKVIHEKMSEEEVSENCMALKREWNNASFAAFLTYEKKADQLASLMQQKNLDLKGFFDFLVKKYQTYDQENIDLSFSDYLFGKKHE